LREAGVSPLFIFSLLGILSIYCYIATIRCRASRQICADEEYGIIDLEMIEGSVILSMSHGQVIHS
jgi:hypothetical protein